MTTDPSLVLLSRKDQPHAHPDPTRRVNPILTRTDTKRGVRTDGTPYVSVSKAVHYRGTTRTGKTFTRWATEHVTLVSARPGQPWLVTNRTPAHRGKKAFWASRHHFTECTPSHSGLGTDLADLAAQHLGPIPSIWQAYPLLDQYADPQQVARDARDWFGDPAAWAPAPLRRRFLGIDNVQDLTRSIFGTSRYRRDLVKATAQATMSDLVLAWSFRGLVPVDWLIEIMREHRGGQTVSPVARAAFRGLDPQSLRNLTRDAAAAPRMMKDIAKMAPYAVDLGRIRSWRHLHDQQTARLLTFGHLADRPSPKPVKHAAEVAAWAGTTPAGAEIVLADHETTLWEWGQRMDHCIGSYGRDLRSKTSILGAYLAPGGAMIGNFEVEARPSPDGEQYRLVQFLGRSNSRLPVAVLADFTDHLTRHDVEVPRTYWGAPGRVLPNAA